MKIHQIIIPISLVLMTACSSISPSENDPLGINGYWVSNCYYDKEFNEYFINEYRFSGNSFVVYYESFDNDTCTEPMIENGGLEGQFSLGKQVITPRGSQAVEINTWPIYETSEHIFPDIIHISEDVFHWGLFIDEDTRPLVIDFNVTYTRKEIDQ